MIKEGTEKQQRKLLKSKKKSWTYFVLLPLLQKNLQIEITLIFLTKMRKSDEVRLDEDVIEAVEYERVLMKAKTGPV